MPTYGGLGLAPEEEQKVRTEMFDYTNSTAYSEACDSLDKENEAALINADPEAVMVQDGREWRRA